MTCSSESVVGPQSFLIEFDAGTKLPVTIKQWANLERGGAPAFSWEKILYFEDLPESAFAFRPPAGVEFVDRDLVIPEANLPLLADPAAGISAEGLTREEACRRILGLLWAASINDDLAGIRRLCPLVASWSDERLRELTVTDEQAVEVLEIGGIGKEGQSPLGPIALVPSRVRCRDGRIREILMTVQFREGGNGSSCVVHGPYGFPVEVEAP